MSIVKNTFGGGLIMDFAPDNTPNSTLTSALNATLITNNGNEFSLQNDMGNGRVETAYLPEGYIPVGTCEFGDIIYIVSYNPIENKSQIGCFPSPERNISSEEVSDLKASVGNDDFQTTDENGNTVLKTTSVKKIIYLNKLYPGDKYVIYSDQIANNKDYLSDYGYGLDKFPRFVKIHVVALGDNGKMTYLDSSVKWYDNYFIGETKQSNGTFDIDSYRDLTSSGYSVFQSKVVGKLALLIELEKIDTYNCSYNIKKINDLYYVYFNHSWSANNDNINPKYAVIEGTWPYANEGKIKYNEDKTWDISNLQICNIEFTRLYKPEEFSNSLYTDQIDDIITSLQDKLTDANLTNITQQYKDSLPEDQSYYLNPQEYDSKSGYSYKTLSGKEASCPIVEITDDVVNNYFKKEVLKLGAVVQLPILSTENNIITYSDTSPFVWNYTITPAMPYGLLPNLAITGSIDFSKVGSGYVELNEWHYYVDSNVLTLKWGLEAYLEENKKISEVSFELYDNKGLCGRYVVPQKESYSGTFTEVLQLGTEGNNPNLTFFDSNGVKIEHKGYGPFEIPSESVDGYTDYVALRSELAFIEGDGYTYYNDAGIIYPNLVYLVKIIVKSDYVDSYGNIVTSSQSTTKTFERWLWTNTIMNDYYYNVNDFDGITPAINVQLGAAFNSNENYSLVTEDVDNHTNFQDLTKTLGWHLERVENPGTTPNLTLTVVPELVEQYNTFKFDEDQLSNLTYKVWINSKGCNIDSDSITIEKSTDDTSELTDFSVIKPQLEDGASQQDKFTLGTTLSATGIGSVDYYDTSSELNTITNKSYSIINAQTAAYGGIPLIFYGDFYSRIIGSATNEVTVDAIVFKPLVSNLDELEKNYNIIVSGDLCYFGSSYVIGADSDEGDGHTTIGIADNTSEGGAFNIPEHSSMNTGKQIGIEALIGNVIAKYDLQQNYPFALLSFWSFCKGSKMDDVGLGADDHIDGGASLKNVANNYVIVNSTWRSSVGSYPNNNTSWGNSSAASYRYANLRTAKSGEALREGGFLKRSDYTRNNTLGALLARNHSKNYILYNCFNSFGGSTGDYVAQTNPQGSSIAKELLPLLTQVYYRANDTQTTTAQALTQYAICSEYSEDWKFDIVLESSYTQNSWNLLSMTELNYTEYRNAVVGYSTDATTNNVDLDVRCNITHNVEFTYTPTYSVDTLKKKYSITGNKYYISPNILTSLEIPSSVTDTVPFNCDLAIYSKTYGFLPVGNALGKFYKVNISDSTLSASQALQSYDQNFLSNLTIQDGIVWLKSSVNQGKTNKVTLCGSNSHDSYNKIGIIFSKDNKLLTSNYNVVG